jgi:hypothetical protein
MTVSYSNGKIYKISHPDCKEYYIGSTAMPKLSQRLAGHRQQAKKDGKHFAQFTKLGLEKLAIELLEKFPCSTKAQLNKREAEFIAKQMTDTNCLNKIYGEAVPIVDYVQEMKHIDKKLENMVKKSKQPITKITTKEVLIGGVLVKVKLRIVPKSQIANYEDIDPQYSRKHAQADKFQFRLNSAKPIAVKTQQLYHQWLNRITRHLKYTTEQDIINYSTEIINWMNANMPQYQRRQTLAAIFYVLTRPEYLNTVRLPYVKAFCACKIESVENNKKLDENVREKLLKKLNSDLNDYDNSDFKYIPREKLAAPSTLKTD